MGECTGMTARTTMFAVNVMPTVEVKITPVEVDKFTLKSVWINGVRANRIGKTTWYFSTYELAIYHMEKMICEIIRQHEVEAEHLRQKLREIDAIRVQP